jgi:8-oxo-dGTP pyrophosphatase MutT (NUDIX family)
MSVTKSVRKSLQLDTPKVQSLKLDFTKNLIETMKNIELAYWDYLDNYTSVDKYEYPSCSFKSFAEIVCRKYRMHANIDDCCSQYDKYKKKLPTAGSIFYYKNEIDTYITTVMIRQYGKDAKKMFSMPKGKKEEYETQLLETAIRETREETGLEISTNITAATPTVTINKTLFYVIESDHLVDFKGHNNREIERVKWTSATDIASNPAFYSRQVHEAMKYLLVLRCIAV